ncbi:MAG: YraN family protein [Candidatus Shapirobacteria bacterium]|nr:YraN family protein [Candidatus Shapirobacteria bacterium]
MKTKNLGQLGENLALQHLKNNGYRILNRNFSSKLGEIDIIAIDSSTLVFVEVKTRWSSSFGSPEEAITPWKIRKIIKTGEYFCLLHPRLPKDLRLDAVVIDLDNEDKIKRIEIIKNLTG